MRLFEATMTIQSLLNGKKELFMKPLCKDDFEDRISEWAKTVISDIDKSDCLNENELLAVEAGLLSIDLYDTMLNESLQLEETDWFEFQHSPYIRKEGGINMEKHYYDFGYFFSSKDSGSIRVTTTEPLDTEDIDACVAYALENDLMEDEYAENIIYVEELTEEDARDMGFFDDEED